jgi:hypothetical protein
VASVIPKAAAAIDPAGDPPDRVKMIVCVMADGGPAPAC